MTVLLATASMGLIPFAIVCVPFGLWVLHVERKEKKAR